MLNITEPMQCASMSMRLLFPGCVPDVIDCRRNIGERRSSNAHGIREVGMPQLVRMSRIQTSRPRGPQKNLPRSA